MAKPLESIIGQPLAVDLCRQWLAKETTHPLLFYGPEGTGKRTLALEVAKVLNGSTHKIDAGQHPDVRVIDLPWQALERKEDLAKQQTLRIETILTERRRLLQSVVEGSWKVSIIDGAHRLTPDAANVLLKVLEEPPARTAIFLMTPFRDRLFPTLVSRCQPVRFRPLTDDEMRQILGRKGIPEESHMKLIELALGSPGRALHMNREEHIQAVQEAEALWQTIPGQRPMELIRALEGRGRTARPTRTDIEQRISALLVPAVRELRGGQPDAGRSVQLLQSALTQLRQNVQPGLVFENLLLQLSRRP
ncbi:MAG: AAA family ATPase [Elusimicrobiota bacterium]|jgi:DNA polymerase-3 subunit delta'